MKHNQEKKIFEGTITLGEDQFEVYVWPGTESLVLVDSKNEIEYILRNIQNNLFYAVASVDDLRFELESYEGSMPIKSDDNIL